MLAGGKHYSQIRAKKGHVHKRGDTNRGHEVTNSMVSFSKSKYLMIVSRKTLALQQDEITRLRADKTGKPSAEDAASIASRAKSQVAEIQAMTLFANLAQNFIFQRREHPRK